MYLTYNRPNILQHETPKLISGNEIPVSMLERSIKEKLSSKICSEIKVIYQAKAVIYESQTYSNSLAVVIDHERHYFKFGKGEGVVSTTGTSYIYYKKLLTMDFSYHYNSYEVHESEIFELCKIRTLLTCRPIILLEFTILKIVTDFCLIPLMFYIQPPE